MSKDELLEKTWTDRLKGDVRFFHAATGMDFPAIGRHAIGNSRMWERMEKGGTITLEKADQLYAWFKSQGYNFNR